MRPRCQPAPCVAQEPAAARDKRQTRGCPKSLWAKYSTSRALMARLQEMGPVLPRGAAVAGIGQSPAPTASASGATTQGQPASRMRIRLRFQTLGIPNTTAAPGHSGNAASRPAIPSGPGSRLRPTATEAIAAEAQPGSTLPPWGTTPGPDGPGFVHNRSPIFHANCLVHASAGRLWSGVRRHRARSPLTVRRGAPVVGSGGL